MLPTGKVTEDAVAHLSGLLDEDDVIIDGGNAFYKDDVRRGRELRAKKLHYIDCGTSGGVWGLERGYCLMIGGDPQVVHRLDPIFAALAPGPGDVSATPGRDGRDPRVERGYVHCGPNGAGRFAKMVHNGIEYGLMQAYAEGIEIMRRASTMNLPADERFTLDLADITEAWRRGSVIGSWLLDLTSTALALDPNLAGYTGAVEDSGEGRWTLMAAIDEAVPADVLAAALFARFRSRDKTNFIGKMLSAMRHEFGGHVEPGKAA
jgi:6-phosphogluconate dehydrogenase